VQAFALTDGSGKVSTENRTDLLGGLGDDLIRYNINAPVGIDGGGGFDRLVVIGTEFDDNFVITKDGVFGAGLNVRYDNIESLEVDGAEGDDHFFIQSTRAGVVTTIDGGNGNDSFEVSGDVTAPIVSRSLEGLSGVINHKVTSGDGAYDGLLAPGISTTVADATAAGQIIIDQTNGTTIVDEQGATVDTYTVRLAGTPSASVYVNVSAGRTTQEEEAQGGDSMLVSTDNVHWSRYLTLTLNSTAAQTVYVKAVDDSLAEGERVYAISHSSQSADPNFKPRGDQERARHRARQRQEGSDRQGHRHEQRRPGSGLQRAGQRNHRHLHGEARRAGGERPDGDRDAGQRRSAPRSRCVFRGIALESDGPHAHVRQHELA